jgi:uncharacterized protein YbjQ (UPF0145 family)
MQDLLISSAISFGPIAVLFLIGLSFGTIAQRRHIADLERREAALQDMLLTNIPWPDGHNGQLVTGSTVVAYDFFRRIAVVFRKIIGGQFQMHQAMMMRARREAILRMAEAARNDGATAIHNIRLVSSNLGHNGSAMGGCEVVAYGTAIWD